MITTKLFLCLLGVVGATVATTRSMVVRTVNKNVLKSFNQSKSIESMYMCEFIVGLLCVVVRAGQYYLMKLFITYPRMIIKSLLFILSISEIIIIFALLFYYLLIIFHIYNTHY